MSTPSDALRLFAAGIFAAPTWRVQFGRLMDDSRQVRYCVIRPAGGLPVSLVREPQFTMELLGRDNDDGAALAAEADRFIEATRASAGAELVFIQAGEPVFTAGASGRPRIEMAVSVIAN